MTLPNCIICLSKVSIDGQLTPCCQQAFCKTCIQDSIKSKKQCPCCRKNLDSVDNCIPVKRICERFDIKDEDYLKEIEKERERIREMEREKERERERERERLREIEREKERERAKEQERQRLRAERQAEMEREQERERERLREIEKRRVWTKGPFAKMDRGWYRKFVEGAQAARAAEGKQGKKRIMLHNPAHADCEPLEVWVSQGESMLRRIRSEVGKAFDLPIFNFQHIRIYTMRRGGQMGGSQPRQITEENDDVFTGENLVLQFEYDGEATWAIDPSG